MKVIATKIPEVLIIEPEVFGDERGFFMETWQRKEFARIGIDYDFVQDNHSCSTKGTLRGLHYQVRQVQGKLVRVTVGEVYDVAVDVRRNSPTFGQWVGEHLSADNKRMMWIPSGFAHGFYVTTAIAELQYKCTDYYAPEYERSIKWDDPTIGIRWPIQGSSPLLSAKDKTAPMFDAAELPT